MFSRILRCNRINIYGSLNYRFLSTTSRDYLIQQGLTANQSDLLLDSLKKMGSPTTTSFLSSFDKEGIYKLYESFEIEASKKQRGDPLNVIMVTPSGEELTFVAREGDTFMDIVEENASVLGSYMELACGGIAACSTCHIIVNKDWFHKLPEPDEEELDMVDLAYGACDESRLGCQVKLTKDLDGLKVKIPDGVNNLW